MSGDQAVRSRLLLRVYLRTRGGGVHDGSEAVGGGLGTNALPGEVTLKQRPDEGSLPDRVLDRDERATKRGSEKTRGNKGLEQGRLLPAPPPALWASRRNRWGREAATRIEKTWTRAPEA